MKTRIASLASTVTLLLLPVVSSYANPVAYSGTVQDVGIPDAYGTPLIIAGDSFRSVVDIDLSSPPQGTDIGPIPGFGGTRTRYTVAGTITGTISGRSISGDVATIIVANDFTTPGNPLPADLIVMQFTIGDCHDPAAMVQIVASDDSAGAFDDTSFYELNAIGPWRITFNVLQISEQSGACIPLIRSIAAGPIDSVAISVPTLIEDLISTVLTLNMQKGVSNSLDGKLQNALRALDDANANNDVAAIYSLGAFINAVGAQSGQMIASNDACRLIASADAVIVALGGVSTGQACQSP